MVIGQQIGRYRVEEELGRGHFGLTHRGVDTAGGGASVALKIAHAHLQQDDLFMTLLERECAPLTALRHPGIASFHGMYAEGALAVGVRDLVQGEDLRRVLARGPVAVEVVPGLLQLMLQALAHAHEQRVIHGDLSPTNLFWCFDGTLRITDFGLARAVHVAQATRTGAASGDFDYFAPEQASGQQSARSDLYAVGLIAYECLVGRPACEPGEPQAKLDWHRYRGVPDPREARPECPDWLARLVLQLAAVDPATRPADARTALGLLRPVTAPTVSGGGDVTATEIGSTASGLQPPPPPERTPPAPPTLERPVLEDTVRTTAPEVFGDAPAFGGGEAFGRTGFGNVAPGPPVAGDHTTAVHPPGPELPPPPAGAGGVATPRVPRSAHERGVDRRIDPTTEAERQELRRRERIKVAVFWSVTIGVLLVATVAFVGYRTMEAKRLAAARAGGSDIDPELLVGGGFDRFADHDTEPAQGGRGRTGDDGAEDQDANTAGAGGQAAAADGGEANERYLLGGEDRPVSEHADLSVSSNPIGARVWLDNAEIGYTPLEGYQLREGRHVVRLELDGYAWASREIEVHRGVPVELGDIVLEREVVAAGPVLLWSVELEGSSVFVDGTHAGKMPVVVEMTPGEHTFFVQPPVGEPVELELRAYPGTDAEPGRLQLEPPR